MPKYKDSAAHSRTGLVGANMFRIRRKLGITQKQLAAPEFSISYISAIERGRIRPSLKALDVLARRLGVTSAELLADFVDDYPLDIPYGRASQETSSTSLIEMLQARPAPYFAALTLCWASILISQHDHQQARDLLDIMTSDSMTAEQHLLRLYFLAHMALIDGRAGEAEHILKQAMEQQEFGNHAELIERCRHLLGRTYEAQGQFLQASEAYMACVQAIDKGVVREPFFIILVYATLADHYRHLERRADAITWYQRVLRQYHYFRDPVAWADISAELSRYHLANVHSTLADWYAARSRSLYEFAGARAYFAQAASHLGLTYQDVGDTQAAEQQMRRTIAFAEELGAQRQAILTHVALADLLLERQEIAEAERLALEAQARCHADEGEPIADETLYGRVLITLADINRAQNRLDEAEQAFQKAIELLKKHNANEYLSQAYFRYSDLLHQKARDAESYEMVKQAYLLAQHGPQVSA